jgi:hypothetical protein
MRFIVVLFALALAVAAPTGAATSTPTLVVVDRTPLTVSGRGFPANREVTLIVTAPGVSERRALRSDRLGRFRLEIRRVSLTGRLRCAVGVGIAARIKGDGLVLWSQRLPNCPVPLQPPANAVSSQEATSRLALGGRRLGSSARPFVTFPPAVSLPGTGAPGTLES